MSKSRFTKKIVGSGEPVLRQAGRAEAAEWIKKAWAKDDGLWTKWDARYRVNTIPELATSSDPALDALLAAAVPRVAEREFNTSIGFEERAVFRHDPPDPERVWLSAYRRAIHLFLWSRG